MEQTISLARSIREAGFKRIFVTGASGFIGRDLAFRLADAGIEVLGLYRNPEAERFLPEGGVRPIKGDISRPQEWNQHLKHCDALFHMAALAASWHPEPETFHKLNYKAAKEVFKEALRADIKRIVFTSTAGTMGHRDNADDPPIDEASILSPDLGTKYEESKLQAENHAASLHNAGEADIVTVNPSRVFGPGMISESNAITKIISWYLKGIWRIIPGDGTSIGNYVYIEDVLQGHMQALLHGRSGERYILGGENADFNQLFQLIEEETGQSRWMIHLPVSLMTTIARGEEWRASLFGGRPLISTSFARKYMKHYPLSTDKAERELNFRPRSLRESIRSTVEWIKK